MDFGHVGLLVISFNFNPIHALLGNLVNNLFHVNKKGIRLLLFCSRVIIIPKLCFCLINFKLFRT